MTLSLVFPMYNEAKRLYKAVDALNALVKTKPELTVEIIFVNDGSTDNSLEVLKALPKNFEYQLVSYTLNQGKGQALKTGILQTHGDYVVFMDVDMSTPITELNKLLPLMAEGLPVIIGSRKTWGARVLKQQKAWRQKLGEGFTFLSNLLLLSGVSDFTCGFKAFRSDVAKKVFGRSLIKRWGYDSETLFLAHQYGYAIREVPVEWHNDEHTRVNLLVDVGRSLTDLLKIRYYNFSGRYHLSS